MNTTLLSVVLVSTMLAGQNAPSWTESYAEAHKQGAQMQKPLAVVFGTGANGWSALVRDDAAKGQLTNKFVCVYVDVTTKNGRDLARSFGIKNDVGIVISDRTGSSQAFWHEGDLSPQALAGALQRYGDPQYVVRGTETGTMSRNSNYEPIVPAAFQGGITSSGFAPAESSYCPNCSNGGGFRRR